MCVCVRMCLSLSKGRCKVKVVEEMIILIYEFIIAAKYNWTEDFVE